MIYKYTIIVLFLIWHTADCEVIELKDQSVGTEKCLVYTCTPPTHVQRTGLLVWLLQLNSTVTTLQPGHVPSTEVIKGTNVEAKANINTTSGEKDMLESNLTFSTTEELNNMMITCKLSSWKRGPATLTVLGKFNSNEVLKRLHYSVL